MLLTKREKKIIKRVHKRVEARKGKAFADNRILIHRTDGDLEWDSHIWLLQAKNEQEAVYILAYHYPVYGLDFNSPYDCTGRPFCAPAIFKQVAPDRFIARLKIYYDL